SMSRARSASVRSASTGEIKHCAGAERTLFARQPTDQRGCLFDSPEPPQRDLRKHEVDVLFRHLIEERRPARSRRDAIDSNSGGGGLLSERLRERDDCGLRGAVSGSARVALLACNGCYVDDAPVIGANHLADCGAVALEGSVDVDVDDPPPVAAGV